YRDSKTEREREGTDQKQSSSCTARRGSAENTFCCNLSTVWQDFRRGRKNGLFGRAFVLRGKGASGDLNGGSTP
ncbi:hypothetical protein ALC57_07068, partial [Trachymyrmex cornetzi]